MIVYEVSFIDIDNSEHSVYFSNKRKASSFIAQNKKHIKEIKMELHGVGTTKSEIISFLNRDNKIG